MSETALDLEYRLTIAARAGCECAPYLLLRKPVLIPAVIEQAAKDDADEVDVFARFARRLYEQNQCPEDYGRRLAGRFAALMALASPAPSAPTTEDGQA